MPTLDFHAAEPRPDDTRIAAALLGGACQALEAGRDPGFGLVPLAAAAGAMERDEDFIALLTAFRSSGGLATGAEIAARSPADGVSRLARWIVQREVLCVEWQGSYWLPTFQFERTGLGLREAARRVCAELPHTLDSWALADWWVTPDALLAERRPVDALADDPDGVLQAARAFHFIVAG